MKPNALIPLAVAIFMTAVSPALCQQGPGVDLEPALDTSGEVSNHGASTDNLTASQPVYLLLTNPAKLESGIFFVHNRAGVPSEVRMDAFDKYGNPLATESLTIDSEQQKRVAWKDLPADTASLILTLNAESQSGVQVRAPRESSLSVGEAVRRSLAIPASEVTDLALYNPLDTDADVVVRDDTTKIITLTPHEVRIVRLSSMASRVWINTRREALVVLAVTASSSGTFSNPQGSPRVITWSYGIDHCGIDATIGEMSPIMASAYGAVERTPIFSNPEPTAPQCAESYAATSNMVLLRHVLTTGEKIWSRYLHLYPRDPGFLVTPTGGLATRIARGQRVGFEGRTGYTCGNISVNPAAGIHLHYEIDTSISMNSFGAVDGSCESLAYLTRAVNPSPNYLAGGSAQVLLPWISGEANPTPTSYQVFGIAGSPLYGSLPLQPSSEKAFKNVGIGGVIYDTTTVANLFSNLSVTLSPASPPLTGQNTFATGDYVFFAVNDDGANGFGRGYEVKFSVLPPGSELVDNDGIKIDTSGDVTTTSRQGYYSAVESDALSVPGYYLSAKLLPTGSSDWARWFPQNSATCEIYVHIPRGANATGVTYKVYLKGRPADGTCSATNATYPCYQTDPISHADNQDKWARLTAANGTITQFAFATSSANGAYVGLSLQGTAAGAYAGADAVKFVAGPSVTSFNVNSGASSTTSRTVTLNNVSTGNPTHYMASESTSFSSATWQIYATAPSFLLSSGNATKTVYFKVKNTGGESPSKSDTITLNEATAPSVTSFSINSDASSTTSRIVTLINTALGSPSHYMASESVSFSGASWQTYATAPNFTLTSGNATKTVYFKIKNSVGESPAKSDVITLNEVVAPSLGAFSINGNAASTTTRSVTLTNTASGSPTHYMASESASFSGAAWQTYATSPSFTLTSGNATKTVYFKIKNTSGESAVKSDSIVLNAPLTYVSAPSPGLYTSGGNVLKLKVTFSGSQATFTVAKKDGSAFTTSGIMTLRSGAINGCVANNNTYYWNFSAGPTTTITSKTFDLANYSGFLSGTKDFYAAIGKPSTYCDGTAPLYYSGKLSITAQ